MRQKNIRENGYSWGQDGTQYFCTAAANKQEKLPFWKRLRRKWRHFVNGVVEYMYIVQHGITPEQLETCEQLGVKPWDRVMEFGGSEHER